MDLSFLKYDFNKEMEKYSFTWRDILFALDSNIINTEEVINYATYILNEDTKDFDIILDLINLDDTMDIRLHLFRLIKSEYEEDQDRIKRKWLYLILKWLYENRFLYQNILQIVEEIYEVFSFPKEITSFVRYLPSESGNLGSIELNRQKLFDNWRTYLKDVEDENIVEII